MLSDHTKRSAYDSTALSFDESIPAPRSQLLEDPLLLYKDGDFYGLFGPVFERNLRFDANLRPDAPGLAKKKRNNISRNNNPGKNFKPPSLGDSDSPIEEVHEFYEYWVHFESWRDFTSQATDELNVENELENAESRYEKRWFQKEIDKRAKQLKTKENRRIQTLVERAMEADPRLRQERLEKQQAKERAKAEREAKVELKRKQEEEARIEAERLADEEKERKAQEKAAREQEKKLIRQERKQLRQSTLSSFEKSTTIWADLYDMNLDVEYLCTSLNLMDLKSLNVDFESHDSSEDALTMIRDRALREREEEKNGSKTAAATNLPDGVRSNGKASASINSKTAWTKDELSALAKAVKKYPPGGASRWDQIALFVNNICKQDEPRSKEECIQKYNEVTKSSSAPKVSSATVTETTTADGAAIATMKEKSLTAPENTNNMNGNTDGGDGWTSEQDSKLQNALAKFPASMEKNERWSAIADAVPGKSKKQCVQRFKAIREALKNRK